MRVRALNNDSIDIIYMSIAISPRIPSGPQGFSTILMFTFGKKVYQETCILLNFMKFNSFIDRSATIQIGIQEIKF